MSAPITPHPTGYTDIRPPLPTSRPFPRLPTLLKSLETRLIELPPNKRLILAIGGIPGSGKTTLASTICAALNNQNANIAIVASMDGFHYPRAVLSAMDDPKTAHERRGAPFTFDGEAWCSFVREINNTDRKEALAVGPKGTEKEIEELTRNLANMREEPNVIYAPSFAHEVKDPVIGDICIRDQKLVILEGNWLLLKEKPWEDVHNLYDATYLVECDEGTAVIRLAQRHFKAGIVDSEEAALARARNNDIPNAIYLLDRVMDTNERLWTEYTR